MFLKIMKQVMEGKFKSLPGNLKRWDRASGVMYKKFMILIGAMQKVGKTSFVTERYIYYPFLYADTKVKIKFYAYEIDLFQFQANSVSWYLNHKYKVRLAPRFIMGREQELDGTPKLPTPEDLEWIKRAYTEFVEPLVGVYDDNGIRTKEGMVDFIVDRQNPNAIYKSMMKYANKNGKWINKNGEIVESRTPSTKEIITGYKENDEDLITIWIFDHLGLIPLLSGKSRKETLDTLCDYLIYFRNLCNFSFIPISQFNRGMKSTDRLKFSGNNIQPSTEDFMETSLFTQGCDQCIALFNPSEFPHLAEHLGYDVNVFQNVLRSVHLLLNRIGDAPRNAGLIFDGKCKSFKELPLANSNNLSKAIAFSQKLIAEFFN
jgi:hypothetical protein